MGQDTCRMPGCDEPPESGKFCGDKHELKYEHLKADARDAKRDAERDAERDASRETRGDPGMSESEFRRMVL